MNRLILYSGAKATTCDSRIHYDNYVQTPRRMTTPKCFAYLFSQVTFYVLSKHCVYYESNICTFNGVNYYNIDVPSHKLF